MAVAAAPLTSLPESKWQNLVIEYARLNGWLVAHFRPAMTRSGRWSTPMTGDTGWPDLVLCGHGRFIVAELKAEGGKLTVEQRAWLDALGEAGVDACVWRPSDWPQVEAKLRRNA